MAEREEVLLLGLPPEMRNYIYELVFENEVLRLDEDSNMSTHLYTCKQIHNEAINIFHANIIFETQDEDEAFNFLTSLSASSLKCIRCFRYDTFAVPNRKRSYRRSQDGRPEQELLDVLIARLESFGIRLQAGVLLVSFRYRTGRVYWSAEPSKDSGHLEGGRLNEAYGMKLRTRRGCLFDYRNPVSCASYTYELQQLIVRP